MLALCRYHFPGNVRELESEIERAVVLADDPELELRHFSERIMTLNNGSQDLPPQGSKLREYLDECERQYTGDALVRNGGKLSLTAQDVGRTTPALAEVMTRPAL